MQKFQIVIVGAGLIGCCLAKELVARGCAVTILDSGEVGCGTSAASFAWVNSNGKEPKAYAELNLLGLRAHKRWAPVNAHRTWFHQTGNIKMVSDARALTELEAKVRRLQDLEYQAILLNPSDVAKIEPKLRVDGIVGAALFPEEGWVDTNLMCTSLVYDATNAGSLFLPFHRVIELTGSGVRGEATNGERFSFDADVVILTAGNGIKDILAASGIDFPTMPISSSLSTRDGLRLEHPTVGVICTTTPTPSAVTHMVHADGISIRPARNGGLTLTDHPTASQWDSADPDIWTVPQLLLERAQWICPTLQGALIDSVVLGNRVLPTDGVSIADWVGSDHRVYAVATHSGVTLAAHIAETVASEVVDGGRHESLREFGLGRFDQRDVRASGPAF